MMEQEFLLHCCTDNLEGVTDCLSNGVDVNTTEECDGQHISALMIACGLGNPAIVSKLVQVPGLDINYYIENGETAAHFASVEGDTDCVRILAETRRVDWNKGNKSG